MSVGGVLKQFHKIRTRVGWILDLCHDELSFLLSTLLTQLIYQVRFKKFAEEAGVSEEVAKVWLIKQAIWQIYFPAPKHILGPAFNVQSPNVVH